MRPAIALAGALALGCAPPSPASVSAEIACAPESRPLRLSCSVRLTDRRTGRPVEGASVALSADMPSMPLAHAVHPVTATPGARAGTYQSTLELPMPGRWVVAARIAGPVRDQITHPIDVGP
jgi:hypothetical protein